MISYIRLYISEIFLNIAYNIMPHSKNKESYKDFLIEYSKHYLTNTKSYTIDDSITFFVRDEELPILELRCDGTILSKGKKIVKDIEIVNSLKHFISNQGINNV